MRAAGISGVEAEKMLKTTPIHALHLKLNAKMAVCGYDMPLWYDR